MYAELGSRTGLRRVSYTYACKPDENRVHISGLGDVEALGRLSYLTSETSIVVSSLDTKGVGPLATIKVVPNSAIAGVGLPDAPKPGEFPDLGKTGDWGGKTFADKVLILIQDRFDAAMSVGSGGITRYISAYHDLGDIDGVPPAIRSAVAIELVYVDGSSKFELYYIAKERPRQSPEWLFSERSQIKGSAAKYVDDLYASLVKAGNK